MSSLNAITTIHAGDGSPIWEVGFRSSADGVIPEVIETLDGSYACRIAVSGIAIDRAVISKTADSKYFRAWLEPAETLGLTGIKTVGIQISNAAMTPPLILEHQITVNFTPGVVPNT